MATRSARAAMGEAFKPFVKKLQALEPRENCGDTAGVLRLCILNPWYMYERASLPILYFIGSNTYSVACPPSLPFFLNQPYDSPFRFQGSGESCTECSLGFYRSLDEDEPFAEGVCLPCPSDSTTLQTGRWLKSQCVCSVGFYDAQVRFTQERLFLNPPAPHNISSFSAKRFGL